MRITYVTILLLLNSQWVIGQIGGKRGFEFLNIPADTRVAALGGIVASLSDWDANMFFANPASLNEEMGGQLSFNHTFYFASVNLNKLAYSHSFEKTGNWGFGVQNINYGSIDGYDPSGNSLGEFKSGEVALFAGNAQQVGNFRIGGNLKLLFSNIGGYHATAMLFDIGGMFVHPSQDLKFGLVIKNFGFVLSDYHSSSNTGIPFDVQIGGSYKPQHMPLRFSVTAYNLYKGDILYYDPGGTIYVEEPNALEKVLSHFTFGAEILISKNVNLRAGYNYLIRRELKFEQRPGGAGFTFGLMIKVKAFEFSYSRAIYNVAGGINYFGIASNLNTFYKKKKD